MNRKVLFGLSAMIAVVLNCYRAEDYEWPVQGVGWPSVSFNTKVIWGNNEFVAAFSEGVAKSIDGKAWIENEIGAQNIAWGNNQYIDVGGYIATSTDAINWTYVLETTPHRLNDVVYGGAGFVAVGDNGLIMKSVDGTNWIQIDSGIQEKLGFVKWAGDKYFVMGIDGNSVRHLYSSANGENFIEINIQDPWRENHFFQDIIFGKSTYILTANSTYYSHDSITWSRISPDFYMDNVSWCDSSLQFVGIKGGGGWLDAPRIYTSADGITWYEHWNALFSGDLQKVFYPDSIACHGEQYVFGGRCDNFFLKGEQSCVMYSP